MPLCAKNINFFYDIQYRGSYYIYYIRLTLSNVVNENIKDMLYTCKHLEIFKIFYHKSKSGIIFNCCKCTLDQISTVLKIYGAKTFEKSENLLGLGKIFLLISLLYGILNINNIGKTSITFILLFSYLRGNN